MNAMSSNGLESISMYSNTGNTFRKTCGGSSRIQKF